MYTYIFMYIYIYIYIYIYMYIYIGIYKALYFLKSKYWSRKSIKTVNSASNYSILWKDELGSEKLSCSSPHLAPKNPLANPFL